MASQITSLTIVQTLTDERKQQSSASLAFVRGIHQWPMNSPHKWPVTRKMFLFDDVIMNIHQGALWGLWLRGFGDITLGKSIANVTKYEQIHFMDDNNWTYCIYVHICIYIYIYKLSKLHQNHIKFRCRCNQQYITEALKGHEKIY